MAILFEPGPFRLIDNDELPPLTPRPTFEPRAAGLAGELAGAAGAIDASARIMASDLGGGDADGLEALANEAAHAHADGLAAELPTLDTDAPMFDELDVSLSAIGVPPLPSPGQAPPPDTFSVDPNEWGTGVDTGPTPATGEGGEEGGGSGGSVPPPTPTPPPPPAPTPPSDEREPPAPGAPPPPPPAGDDEPPRI